MSIGGSSDLCDLKATECPVLEILEELTTPAAAICFDSSEAKI